MINFSKIIKDIRTAKELTQEQLAESTNTSQGYIYGIEKGRIKKPGYDFIQNLVIKHNVNPYVFIYENEPLFKPKNSELTQLRNKIKKYEKLITALNATMTNKDEQ